MKRIAICMDIEELKNGGVNNPELCSRFPGALWMSTFSKLARDQGYEVVSGDQTNGPDNLIIQECLSSDGMRLLSEGAEPAVLTGFESPLYAPQFYMNLDRLAPLFSHRFLFSGAINPYWPGKSYPIYFPIFSKAAQFPQSEQKWEAKKHLALVMSNKHYRYFFHRLGKEENKFVLGLSQLQDMRYEAIQFFGDRNELDLYGQGWESKSYLPSSDFQAIIEKLNPYPIKNKLDALSQCQFTLCFENIAYPGYVTEKIIDCFVAGSIPVYMGATDIEDFVPRALYVDARQYSDFSELSEYLHRFRNTDQDNFANAMIRYAREWLRGEGARHSYEDFAQSVLLKVLSHDKAENRGHAQGNPAAEKSVLNEHHCPESQ